MARTKLIERGIIEHGLPFKTADGVRSFAAGDQIVFLKNEGSIGVKNGMLGKVVEAAPGRLVSVIGEGEHCARLSSNSASTTMSIMDMPQRCTKARARP